MTATVTEAGARPALPRVRHGILAAALLAVAALRWYQGDDVWAAVFGVAGAAEVYVAVATRRQAADEPAPTADAVAPAPAELDLALVRHLQALRLWTGLAVVALVGAVVVLAAEPSLAIVLAGVGLACLFRVRRTRRSVATLKLLS